MNNCSHQFEPIRLVTRNGSQQLKYECTLCGVRSQPVSRSDMPMNHQAQARLITIEEQQYAAEVAIRERQQRIRELDEKRERERAEWRAKYNAYMGSEQWKHKRRKVMERDNYTCRGCGENRATEIHHSTYKHLGRELLFELVAVCRKCHEIVHNQGDAEWEDSHAS